MSDDKDNQILLEILTRAHEADDPPATLCVALAVVAQDQLQRTVAEGDEAFKRKQATQVLMIDNLRKLLSGPIDMDLARWWFDRERAIEDRDEDALQRGEEEILKKLREGQ
jgi:hypothetical protein